MLPTHIEKKKNLCFPIMVIRSLWVTKKCCNPSEVNSKQGRIFWDFCSFLAHTHMFSSLYFFFIYAFATAFNIQQNLVLNMWCHQHLFTPSFAEYLTKHSIMKNKGHTSQPYIGTHVISRDVTKGTDNL